MVRWSCAKQWKKRRGTRHDKGEKRNWCKCKGGAGDRKKEACIVMTEGIRYWSLLMTIYSGFFFLYLLFFISLLLMGAILRRIYGLTFNKKKKNTWMIWTMFYCITVVIWRTTQTVVILFMFWSQHASCVVSVAASKEVGSVQFQRPTTEHYFCSRATKHWTQACISQAGGHITSLTQWIVLLLNNHRFRKIASLTSLTKNEKKKNIPLPYQIASLRPVLTQMNHQWKNCS
jgi:hypothetical protein